MNAALHPHSGSVCNDVESIHSVVTRISGMLVIQYIISGAVDRIVVPAPTLSRRQDDLWSATCFELFIAGQGESYAEFNFAPSGAWAAYMFDAYRDGMQPLSLEGAPAIAVECSESMLRITASMTPPDLFSHHGADISLAAVIQLDDRTKSYWALAHAAGPPDFHNRDCFIAKLP